MIKLFYILFAFVALSSVASASEGVEQSLATGIPLPGVIHDIVEDHSKDKFGNQALPVEVFQIGSQFERSFLRPGDQDALDQKLKKAALSTAEFGTGSAFYLGSFNGRHLMATNAHVMMVFSEVVGWTVDDYNENPMEACKIFPGDPESESKYVRFALVEREFDCKQVISVWPEIDFAIFEIEVSGVGDFAFEGMGVSLKHYDDFFKGQPLVMFSYGTHNNPGSFDFDLAHTQGKLCKVFSNETRQLQEADSSKSSVWSIATGCDISVGDSGSAIFDPRTGLFTGIIWAGAADKTHDVWDDSYLQQILDSKIKNEEMIWTQMNYAVPAAKISAVIFNSLDSKSASSKKLLKAVFR